MIEITNVTMDFVGTAVGESKRAVRALDDISITIPDGCVYGFLGSNGAGKSTLMRLMCGVYRMQSGSITIDGREVWDNPEAKADIFFVNDETVQYADFTLAALAKYFASYYDRFSQETFVRLIKTLGLPTDRKMVTFSKGMKRQSIVAAALSCGTKYMVMDEAFDGLDPAMRKMLKDIIVDEMIDRNATLIVSSHNVAEINELCDRAMLLHQGKLVFDDEIDNIRGSVSKVQIARRSGVVTQDEIEALGLEVMKYSATGSVTQAVVKGVGEEITDKLEGLSADFVELVPLTLEEVFIYELEARGYGYESLAEN
ncbi:MAG: ABC transporter ATP-binding protein [Lachnospiraceae bacterium]|nr:ABC transporter ATP-binding protein [Lachnospiraceae bacterium]